MPRNVAERPQPQANKGVGYSLKGRRRRRDDRNEFPPTAPQLPQPPEEITITELVARYWQFAEEYYGAGGNAPSKELQHAHRTLGILRQHYGYTKAADFGPQALRVLRERLIELGWCRRHVTQNTSRVKRLFRWGAENELVPGNTWHALQAVGGLRQGRSRARENKPVRPVPIEMVEAVKPFVCRKVWAMVQLQLPIAARRQVGLGVLLLHLVRRRGVGLHQPMSNYGEGWPKHFRQSLRIIAFPQP